MLTTDKAIGWYACYDYWFVLLACTAYGHQEQHCICAEPACAGVSSDDGG